MGNKLITFTDQQLVNYQVKNLLTIFSVVGTIYILFQDCTFFTRKEILRQVTYLNEENFFVAKQQLFRVYKKFREMKPDVIPRVMKKNEAYSIKIPVECTEQLAEFRVSYS